MTRAGFLLSCLVVVLGVGTEGAQAAPRVQIQNDQLVIDGTSQPQLFGAEVQYFRMRGGYGPNVPRARVLELWAKALDRVVEAHMNAIEFYIPWDFHEYAKGKFDFDGTADEDHDGNPDYPSRDVITFFKMIDQRGIKIIHARPGPYINAEWGYLGFGAIPTWFHDTYPNSHMKTSWGWNTRLYDYADPDLLRHTRIWFQTLYDQVLKTRIGAGKPIVFLQLDNETNYQWQSIYTHDYGTRSVARYQDFLKRSYATLESVNAAHHRAWLDWSQIQPPIRAKENIVEDQDWYRFSDETMYLFIAQVRKMWESIGVTDQDVLFTLAESYNAPENGVLPNFVYRNAPGKTGLMTVNLYPKTFETMDRALVNSPFKTDLDVKSADEANDAYLGSRQEWVMGPEIQGGWWKGIHVSRESRQQTYLSVLGHGMKALFIYYFNEGNNWGVEWAEQRVRPIFNELRREWNVEQVPVGELSNEFWGELQARSDRTILVGYETRKLMQVGYQDDLNLFFDAPLDLNVEPREQYFHLKMLGERLMRPYGDFLARAKSLVDDVALVKDSASHVPSPIANIDSVWASSDWTGGLLGLMMNADVNPQILHGDLSDESLFDQPRVLMHIDKGNAHPRTTELLKKEVASGKILVNFLGDKMMPDVGFEAVPSMPTSVSVYRPKKRLPFDREDLSYYLDQNNRLVSGAAPNSRKVAITAAGPIFTYDLSGVQGCEPVLYWHDQVAGYRCRKGETAAVQIGALIFNDYNESFYHLIDDARERRGFMKALIAEGNVTSHLTLSADFEKTVAFARKDPAKKLLWITVKTGARKQQTGKLVVSEVALRETLGLNDSGVTLRVRDLLKQTQEQMRASELSGEGFEVSLDSEDSTVFVVEAI